MCGGGERKTISDDEDIYSDQQKLPRRIASKVQVSWLSIYYVYTSTSILPYGYMVCINSETEKVPKCEQVSVIQLYV